MAELVKKDPVAPAGDAIRAIKLEAVEEFSEDEELLNEIVDSLGSFHSLEQRLFRVRNNIIGPNPRLYWRRSGEYDQRRVCFQKLTGTDRRADKQADKPMCWEAAPPNRRNHFDPNHFDPNHFLKRIYAEDHKVKL